MPLISVIVPLYNKISTIRRAIDSILNQSVGDFEIIVVDDGSTDGGQEIVKSTADTRIRLIRQANAGPGAARNRGIENAKSELIAFLDADDEWKPDFLKTILNLRDRFGDAGLYATAYEIESPAGRFIPAFRHIPPYPWEGIIPNFFKMMLGEPAVCSSAVAVPKNTFNTLGLFTSQKACGEDQQLWCRIALHYPICFSWYAGAIYHKDAENRTCDQLADRIEFEDRLALQAAAIGASMETINDIEEFVQKKKIRSASRYILWGHPNVARKTLLRCSTRVFRKEKWFWLALSFLPTGVVNWIWEYKQRYTVRCRKNDRNAKL
jgi:glycosyltransferase involved in cell wall biosynthesis